MCIFCASIPVAVSVGAAVNVKQKERQHHLISSKQSPPRIIFPVGKVVTGIIVGLIAGSVVYHIVVYPKIGI